MRGKEEEWGTDGRVKRWREGSTDGGGIETRSQNEDGTWTKMCDGRKERQVEVKVYA